MHHHHRESEQKLADEVPVADRVDAVGGDPRKPQQRREGIAVDWNAGACKRPGAQRHAVGLGLRRQNALDIPLEHLDEREEKVREKDGLRLLEVRVARYDYSEGRPRLVEERHLQRGEATRPRPPHASITNRRMSVATWSFLLLPVLTFPP